MANIPEKTLEDLEYSEVLRQCADFAITSIGKEVILELKPQNDGLVVMNNLQMTSEYCASFENENRIPNHGFEDISPNFTLLKIDNSVLELETFRNLALNTETSNTLVRFLGKFKTYYPTLHLLSEQLHEEKLIKPTVDGIIDRFGQVRNDASDTLYSIRKQIQQIVRK